MRHGRRAFEVRDRDEVLRDERLRERRRQRKARPRTPHPACKARQDEVARELLAHVDHVRTRRADRQRPSRDVVQPRPWPRSSVSVTTSAR